jgi:hypothetical protein
MAMPVRSRPAALWCCSVLLLAGPSRAGAQWAAGADLTLTTRRVWHGLTRTTRPSMAAQVYGTRSWASSFVAAGVGADFEPLRARAGDLSDNRTGQRGFGEFDAWGEGATRFDGGDASIGVATAVDRPDPNRPGTLQHFTTVEIYSRVRLTRSYLSPSIAAHWDVDRVQGLYLEPGISIPLLANPEGAPFWAAYISASAGFDFGQQPDPDRATQRFYYAGKGLTHVDLGVNFTTTPITRRGWVDSHLDFHLQFNRDAQTKRHRTTGRPSDTTIRVELVLSWPQRGGRSE